MEGWSEGGREGVRRGRGEGVGVKGFGKGEYRGGRGGREVKIERDREEGRGRKGGK